MSRVSSGPPYTAFPRGMVHWITAMVAVGSFISPVTANIYFPALQAIADDLDVSVSLINLTLTTYMIFQGLAPTLFGDFGDMAGRRPAYILAFTIYLFANVGLAVQRNYAALMVLRCVQSAGSSGTIALGYAMVADIAPTSRRGKYIGFIGAGINVGPTLGPALGGLLSQYLGWPSIFWFLAILVAVWLVPWVLTVPETCRNVVGNGSLPAQSWNMPLMYYFDHRKDKTRPQDRPRTEFRFPNPLRTLVVIFEKEMSLILGLNSLLYIGFILVSSTLGTLFHAIYGYNDLESGLCYLPFGFGACIAVIGQGYVLDWNYRRLASKLGIVISRRRADDLSKFPIESARIQPIYPAVLLGAGALVGYGWALQAETTVAVPLVLVFLIGLFVPTSFNVLNTLIVDLYPQAPATATAANNLVRCLVGAGGAAVIELVIHAVGRGWTFTILALLVAVCVPGLMLIEKRGPGWRRERYAREAARAAEKQ
ncbi:Sugar (and other) transporter [Geosmithia morbida]|uniref:Sugar (And other) transporter n=1 Tax=Geosmithia morbida TaxID=1094350 RepID=A0A9P4Z0Z2_9HYPO|nr:Sugar (and other) transporter [Geosmithia morbida]KAF4126698.1 Sugar (and other) transporter [Geosmithia morbida]